MDLDEPSTPSASPPTISHTDDADDLFPAHNDPPTPQNDHLNAAAPGELSPPRSQTRYSTNGTSNMDHGDTMDRGDASSDSEAGLASYNNNDTDTGASFGTAAADDDVKPGYGWKSKKAVEESQRAWEYITDRDFSLKEFGDVMSGTGK